MLQAVFTKNVNKIEVSGLTQWNRGQELEVTIPDLPESFEAHFSYKGAGTAYVVDATGKDGTAVISIPNIIFTQSKDAVCWIYYTDGDSGETVKTIYLPIEAREKPSDYVYTEYEVLSYKSLEERIKALEKGGASDDAIAQAVSAWLEENPIQSGATEAQAKQIQENATNIGKLQDTMNDLTAKGLPSDFVNSLCDILSETLQGTDQTANIQLLRDNYGTGSGGDDSGEGDDSGGDTPITTYTVTYNLDGYTSSNAQTEVTSDNAYYETILTLESGNDAGNITVTMDGVDVTSDVLTDSYILISQVTGDIVITAKAISLIDVPMVAHAGGRLSYVYRYPELIADGNEEVTYTCYAHYTTEVFEEDAEVAITITNNTDADVSLSKCFYGEIEIPQVDFNKSAVNISKAKPFTGTVPANGSLIVKYTVSAGRKAVITHDGTQFTFTAKASTGTKPDSDGWTPYSAELFNTGLVMEWYEGADDTTELIKSDWSVASYVSPVLSAGVYQVAMYGNSTDGAFNRCGVYDGVTNNKVYNVFAFNNVIPMDKMLISTGEITVPEGCRLVAKQSTATLAGMTVYYRKVA